MVKVRVRPETGNLYLDFGYRGARCREYTALTDTPSNRRQVQALARRIEHDLRSGSFEYGRYFPDSPRATRPLVVVGMPSIAAATKACAAAAPTFREFAETWFKESEPRWRKRYHAAVRDELDKHLLPWFGDKPIPDIGRADILGFRAEFARRKGRRGALVSAKRINKVIGVFSSILNEACDRQGVPSPARGIKPLKQKRSEILPFSLAEVDLMVATVRQDYRAYLIVRFFTGLRTGEVNGLQWQDIDFAENLMKVERSVSRDGDGELKTEGSHRVIQMVPQVRAALQAHLATKTESCPWVFSTRHGNPIDAVNFTNRVWYPLLRLLGLRLRAPYQTRHTAATLMLAAGENPEWVAHTLGHSTTEMLFRVYSRFIPNLTRNDGRAFAGLLSDRSRSATAPSVGLTRSQIESLGADELRTLLLQRVREQSPGSTGHI
ncbi:MAG: site-specific integrase [Rhodanobacter sp.]|nr:MAG: site-specific integrase [Rhodanobacter sp.]